MLAAAIVWLLVYLALAPSVVQSVEDAYQTTDGLPPQPAGVLRRHDQDHGRSPGGLELDEGGCGEGRREMNAMSNLFVVLSTYNGGAYLRPLIESIRRQSLADWTLLVRDDGSSDETVPLLRQAAAEDRRIVLLDGGKRLGASASFGLLMQHAYDLGAEYLLLADQDDVWHPDKIERMLERMRRGSRGGKRGTGPISAKTRACCPRSLPPFPRSPQLVYSDLTVVDAELRTVHPSFLRHSRLRHGEGRPLRTLLGRCFVLGCASIVNRPLLEFALPLPESVASHDWWLALFGGRGRTGLVSARVHARLSAARAEHERPGRLLAGLQPAAPLLAAAVGGRLAEFPAVARSGPGVAGAAP